MSAPKANRSWESPWATRSRRRFQPMIDRVSMQTRPKRIGSLTIDGLTIPYYIHVGVVNRSRVSLIGPSREGGGVQFLPLFGERESFQA